MKMVSPECNFWRRVIMFGETVPSEEPLELALPILGSNTRLNESGFPFSFTKQGTVSISPF